MIKRLLARMPFKFKAFFYDRGWGLVDKDHPDAGPISYEIVSPNGKTHIITIDADGRVHGLPGSPPHGLMGGEEHDKWIEKMKAFGSW